MLVADVGSAPLPLLTTSSPTAKGATRHYRSTGALVQDVGDARIWSDIHYRTATEIGALMGCQVGELAVPQLRAAP